MYAEETDGGAASHAESRRASVACGLSDMMSVSALSGGDGSLKDNE